MNTALNALKNLPISTIKQVREIALLDCATGKRQSPFEANSPESSFYEEVQTEALEIASPEKLSLGMFLSSVMLESKATHGAVVHRPVRDTQNTSLI
ncbi:hypothetical protein [Vibrio agarivorans]|uniref:hypothetical protein n=1 Tax=Vibrio agarivorans TaxID=153622 RepID=UPI0025B38C60|nr:hypothetical protein [Vibrio agarivorans]MDN3661115.1 hypothetical protein [Vibrio agarivorans]